MQRLTRIVTLSCRYIAGIGGALIVASIFGGFGILAGALVGWFFGAEEAGLYVGAGSFALLGLAIFIVELSGYKGTKSRAQAAAASNEARTQRVEKFRERADRARLLKSKPVRDNRHS